MTVNSKAGKAVNPMGQEFAIMMSIIIWAAACLMTYQGLSWLLHQPKFRSLSGGTGYQDAEFRYFALATICCLGIWLWLTSTRFRWGREHRSFVVAWAILAVAAVSFVREVHPQSWDFMCYYLAGRGMAAGINIYDPDAVATFNAKFSYGVTYYTYTPLLAAMLGQVQTLVKDQVFTLFSFFNFFALTFCSASLYLTLLRYRFSRIASAITMLVAFSFSVPVIRTLLHSQVNLWVLTFILVSVLTYRSTPFLSALSLVLAANLKVTPILLVGLFILKRDWMWLLFFAVGQLFITALTSWMYAPDYWGYFAAFAQRASMIVNPTHMRNNSFDASIAHVFFILDIQAPILQKWLLVTLKTSFVLWGSKLTWDAIRKKALVAHNRDAWLLNGLPLFLVVMVMFSPLIWPYHFVFLLLPVLVMLRMTCEKRTFKLLLLVYGSLFMIPVFDVFPLSSHRLIAVVLYFYCANLIFKEDKGKPTAVEQFIAGLKNYPVSSI